MKPINKIIFSYLFNKIQRSKTEKEKDNWTYLYFKAMKKEWNEMTLQEKYKVS